MPWCMHKNPLQCTDACKPPATVYICMDLHTHCMSCWLWSTVCLCSISKLYFSSVACWSTMNRSSPFLAMMKPRLNCTHNTVRGAIAQLVEDDGKDSGSRGVCWVQDQFLKVFLSQNFWLETEKDLTTHVREIILLGNTLNSCLASLPWNNFQFMVLPPHKIPEAVKLKDHSNVIRLYVCTHESEQAFQTHFIHFSSPTSTGNMLFWGFFLSFLC